MCGIAGFVGPVPGDLSATVLLKRMIDAIGHRGPDEQGIHIDPGVGLAHARLSIIDLSSGQQPMANEDGSIWVTFNGEIFNYVELAERLRATGHRFRTHSDTEVIVHSYEQNQEQCVDDFNGDFAFAIWDSRRRRLVLARDRMGVRPVYYMQIGQTFAFASEVKALAAIPGVDLEIDPIALDQTFTFWSPIAPRTIFRGVSELPPGHMLTYQDGRIAVRRYWSLQYPKRGDAKPISESVAAEELHDLLVDATRLRLRADVPVGAYLSGGLDSSVTTALIRNYTKSHLRTFSVTFESSEFDESEYQQELVRALGTEHSSVLCTRDDIGRLLPQVIRHAERPILRTAPAPLMLLSQHVRENGFKVVMTGEGADEILAGYDIFKEAKIRRFWAGSPGSPMRPRLLRKLYPYLVGLQGQPQPYLEAFFRAGLDDPGNPFFSHLPRWRMTSRLKQLFSDDVRDAISDYNALEDLSGQLPAEFGQWGPLSQAQYLETSLLLPGYILSSQGDRMAMAHAVEGRFPFLDHRVVEYANMLPARLKLRGLREKHILRVAMSRHLPETIANRPKQPYRSPDAESFFGKAQPEYVREMLSEDAIRQTGLFDVPAVAKLVEKCEAGRASGFRDNMALVGVLSAQLLHMSMVGKAAQGARQVAHAAG